MKTVLHWLLLAAFVAGTIVGSASPADAQRRAPRGHDQAPGRSGGAPDNRSFRPPSESRSLRPPPDLQQNPRYRGRVLGTHVVRDPRTNRMLYEMRILTPDDRVILVYVDPQTGRVVGDTAGGRR